MKKKTKQKIQWFSICLFAVYLVFMIYFLFFAEGFGRVNTERGYTYNLVLFREIRRFWNHRELLGMKAVIVNIAGNVICFIPFGAILPVLCRKARKLFAIVLLSFEFSLLVECAQLLLKVGSFDVDDLFLNTLGGLIGFLLFLVCDMLRRKKYG
ncbi:MAG: VanZ family protein [Eubacteriales bacterium]|nr:VanZ family protein [Eubacteriales bacterium]